MWKHKGKNSHRYFSIGVHWNYVIYLFLWSFQPKQPCETVCLSWASLCWFFFFFPLPTMTLLTPFWVCDSLGTGSSSYLRGCWIYLSCNHFHIVRHNMELINSIHLYSARVSRLKILLAVGLTAFPNSVCKLALEKETLQLHLYPLLRCFSVLGWQKNELKFLLVLKKKSNYCLKLWESTKVPCKLLKTTVALIALP